ncbi:MAG: PIN domain-containing protein [archaeon]|nr:PIN domain-containing protein [archaeon]
MYFIDTNIFFEWLLGREKAKECEQLLEALEKSKMPAFCSHFSVHSVCIYFSKNKMPVAKKFVKYVKAFQALQTINTSLEDDFEILEAMTKFGLDFDDALQYYMAKQIGCTEIITFDKDFKKTDLKPITPSQALKELGR